MREPAPRAARLRPTLVLVNPGAAGGRAAERVEPMRRWLEEHAPHTGLIVADSLERSRAQLQCLPRSSRVVLVGGDGTLHHLLPVLLTHRLTVGLVPLGSGNDTARAIGVAHLPWRAALDLALHGPTRRMDVGELLAGRDSVPFLTTLATGLDAEVSTRMAQAPARLIGEARYRWALWRELVGSRPQAMRVVVDGVTGYDGALLCASVFNAPTCSGGVPAMPGARIADGRLDLLLAGAPEPLGPLALLPRLLTGRHLGHAPLLAQTFESLRIEADAPLPIAADGETLAPMRAFSVRIRASALTVVSPRSHRTDPGDRPQAA